jgi:hypothetical protein
MIKNAPREREIVYTRLFFVDRSGYSGGVASTLPGRTH